MNFKSELHTDGYVDGLGNCSTLEPDRMDLESEIAPLEACFSYSDYNEAFHLNESEVDNLQSDMKCDEVDVDINSEEEQSCERKKSPYRKWNRQVICKLNGTTANHFFEFVKSVVREIETNEELKEIKYSIPVNAAIHKRRDLELLVASSGLELVFLHPYLPGLNAFEEFWSACKAKVKQSNLSRKEKLTPRVREATAKITLESYQGFCRHANDHMQHCLESRSF
ncbi:hypothetical protein CANMA_005068 [Candida margitis]|uniref:uncharacterized protein n=1 Tax=Candida margitis TaxID=1775924 RepID=UPI002227302C|nr:uncharacterized protein CANMA_005068 [Candida margitis]KAI5952225.1 hypothetical protein CANMA_005068 [Candida margitis]